MDPGLKALIIDLKRQLIFDEMIFTDEKTNRVKKEILEGNRKIALESISFLKERIDEALDR